MYDANSWILCDTTFHIGDAASRIEKGWFNYLDVSNLSAGTTTVTGIATGDINLQGNDLLNVDDITGTSTDATINNMSIGQTTAAAGSFTTLTSAGTTTLASSAGALTLGTTTTAISSNAPITFASGVAMTAASYQMGRDADATNQMHFNVPTGATFEWSVNDVSIGIFSASSAASALDAQNAFTFVASDTEQSSYPTFLVGLASTYGIGLEAKNAVYGLPTLQLGYSSSGGVLDLYNYRSWQATNTNDMKFTTKGSGAAAVDRLTITGNVTNSIVTFANSLVAITPAVATSGSAAAFTITPAASTTLTAGTDAPQFVLATSSPQWATGALALATYAQLNGRTLNFVGASVVAEAATLWVSPPITGTFATITDPYSAIFTGRIKSQMAITLSGADAVTPTTTTSAIFNNAGLYFRLNTSTSTNRFYFQIGASGIASFWREGLDLGGVASAAGVPVNLKMTPPANTGITAGSNAPQFSMVTSTQTWATGAVAEASYAQIAAPTFGAAAASIFSQVSTFTVTGAPILGGNATFTASAAIWAKAGQYWGAGGTVAAPTYSFAAAVGAGMYEDGRLRFAHLGVNMITMAADGVSLVSMDGLSVSTRNSNAPTTLLTLTPFAVSASTAGAERTDISLVAKTQTWATGAVANQRYNRFDGHTIAAVGGSLFSNVTNFWIDTPNISTNATVTTLNAAQIGGDFLVNQTAATVYGAIGVPAHTATIGTLGTQITSEGFSALRLGIITLTSGTATTVDASATAYFAGAPVAAGSITLSKPYTIWSDAGNNRFDGLVIVGTTTPVTASTELTVSAQTGTSTVAIGESGVTAGCLKIQDSDLGGWSYFTVLDGTMTGTTTDVCD
jgi:hypothetical protein